MEAGNHGATGVCVMRPVVEVIRPGLGTATSRSTVESLVQDPRCNINSVTSNHAPVSIEFTDLEALPYSTTLTPLFALVFVSLCRRTVDMTAG